jgi:8-oxo-dGTP pyrophosphatase MutT (NUDIX family)
MHKGTIRPLAICVVRRGPLILVERGFDPTKNETFYRPLGGGIEFGEHSRAAVVREIREEIGAEITDLRLLGTLENIFTFDGVPGHEIVQIYEAVFVDPALYERDTIDGFEIELGAPVKAMWMPLDTFRAGTPPLYPDGLWDLLVARWGIIEG